MTAASPTGGRGSAAAEAETPRLAPSRKLARRRRDARPDRRQHYLGRLSDFAARSASCTLATH